MPTTVFGTSGSAIQQLPNHYFLSTNYPPDASVRRYDTIASILTAIGALPPELPVFVEVDEFTAVVFPSALISRSIEFWGPITSTIDFSGSEVTFDPGAQLTMRGPLGVTAYPVALTLGGNATVVFDGSTNPSALVILADTVLGTAGPIYVNAKGIRSPYPVTTLFAVESTQPDAEVTVEVIDTPLYLDPAYGAPFVNVLFVIVDGGRISGEIPIDDIFGIQGFVARSDTLGNFYATNTTIIDIIGGAEAAPNTMFSGVTYSMRNAVVSSTIYFDFGGTPLDTLALDGLRIIAWPDGIALPQIESSLLGNNITAIDPAEFGAGGVLRLPHLRPFTFTNDDGDFVQWRGEGGRVMVSGEGDTDTILTVITGGAPVIAAPLITSEQIGLLDNQTYYVTGKIIGTSTMDGAPRAGTYEVSIILSTNGTVTILSNRTKITGEDFTLTLLTGTNPLFLSLQVNGPTPGEDPSTFTWAGNLEILATPIVTGDIVPAFSENGQQLPSRYFFDDTLPDAPDLRRYSTWEAFLDAILDDNNPLLLELAPAAILNPPAAGSYQIRQNITIYSPNGDALLSIGDIELFANSLGSEFNVTFIGGRINAGSPGVRVGRGVNLKFKDCTIISGGLSVYLFPEIGNPSADPGSLVLDGVTTEDLLLTTISGAFSVTWEEDLQPPDGAVRLINGTTVKQHPNRSQFMFAAGTAAGPTAYIDSTCILYGAPILAGATFVASGVLQIEQKGQLHITGTSAMTPCVLYGDDVVWSMPETEIFSPGRPFEFGGENGASSGAACLIIRQYPRGLQLPIIAEDGLGNIVPLGPYVRSVDPSSTISGTIPEEFATAAGLVDLKPVQVYDIPNGVLVYDWRGNAGRIILAAAITGAGTALTKITGGGIQNYISGPIDSQCRIVGNLQARGVNDNSFAQLDIDILVAYDGVAAVVLNEAFTSPVGGNPDGYIVSTDTSSGDLQILVEYPGGDTEAYVFGTVTITCAPLLTP